MIFDHSGLGLDIPGLDPVLVLTSSWSGHGLGLKLVFIWSWSHLR